MSFCINLKYALRVALGGRCITVVLHELFIHVPFFCRWRSHIILSRLPRESWPEMQLKCAAYEAFNKRRPNWGFTQTWLGDYLAQVRSFVLEEFILCIVVLMRTAQVATTVV